MGNNLKIYRASAGSGKTFTLALEYIKLLVANPYSYRNILAVTFTNKATAEMKERILGKLYGVANGLSSAADYTEKIKEQMPGISEETIRENAGKAMNLILHDYGHFRIQTIDAFFQSVLRSLAKELDLNGDMEISLDGEELLNDAVDTYIKELEPNTKNITQVVKYIKDKMSDSDKWKIDKEIKSFAKNILREEYQQRGTRLREQMEENDGAALTRFYEGITKLKRDCIAKAVRNGERFHELASGFSHTDFKGGKTGIWLLFSKMKNGEVVPFAPTRAALASTPSEISKTNPHTDEIARLIKESIPLHSIVLNCDLSLEYYHQLAMLNNIAATLKDENTRENRFMLAETTHLLSTMIGKSATFIFEKIGTEIDHIFIDEFQDTSKLQWTCFKVLLEEVLARGNFNLIVGDVKQSIYRWRNSDWSIMNNIGNYFRRDQTTLAVQDVTLDGVTYKSTNYRSDRRIISFNNALYRSAVGFIEANYEDKVGVNGINEIKSAYEDVEQAVPLPKPGKAPKPLQGYVEVRMLKKNDDEDKYRERAIEELIATLHRLLDVENIAPRDIAILIRKKKDTMQPIVDAFNQEFPHLKIVSDEAYKLSSSLCNRLVIAAMRYIASPEDSVNAVSLVKLYNKVVLGKDEDFSSYTPGCDITTLLPEKFISDLARLKGLPVYELIEQIFALLGIGKTGNEEAYIFSFLDYASQYINSRCADINRFLEAWDDGMKDECIPAESIDSVRIMTVHKSKGLEFHTVIIPFCDWKMTGDSRSILWCETSGEPFEEISLLPIHNKKEMLESIYKNDYYKEYLYQIVDNLNILYVATTRAKSNLIMFTNNIAPQAHNISLLLNTVVPNLGYLDGSFYDESAGVWSYGTIVHSEKDRSASVEKNDNPFEETPTTKPQPFVYHNSKIEFRQSRELEHFLATGSEEKKQHKYIEVGELMHLVLSDIEVREDLDAALERILKFRGLISSEKQYNRTRELLIRALDNPKAKEWFDGRYKLFNERSILVADDESDTRRPDRVMINGDTAVVVDYKFATPKDDHDKQVKLYMKLLRQMGYKNISGYLWYVYKNEIIEVKREEATV